MKFALAVIAIWTVLPSLASAEAAKLPLKDAVRNWRTARIVLVIDGGDYDPPAPYILLQRLDAERIVLSTGEHSYGVYLPVARAIITATSAQKLIDRAVAFYLRAEKETGEKARVKALPQAERDAIYKNHGFGISATYIRIEVLGPSQSYQYQDDFADDGDAFKEFADFIEQQSK